LVAGFLERRCCLDPRKSRWAFAPHWSASLEYNYYDFGDNGFTLTDTLNHVSITASLKDRIHTVTTGVSYHF
jgi:outer membrane immunogenic protein